MRNHDVSGLRMRNVKNDNHAENGSSGRIRVVNVAVGEVGTKRLVRVARTVSREKWKRERDLGGQNENHARVRKNRESGRSAVGVGAAGAVASGARHETEMRAVSGADGKTARNAVDGTKEMRRLTLKSKSR